jgi:hypothetical protein
VIRRSFLFKNGNGLDHWQILFAPIGPLELKSHSRKRSALALTSSLMAITVLESVHHFHVVDDWSDSRPRFLGCYSLSGAVVMGLATFAATMIRMMAFLQGQMGYDVVFQNPVVISAKAIGCLFSFKASGNRSRLYDRRDGAGWAVKWVRSAA